MIVNGRTLLGTAILFSLGCGASDRETQSFDGGPIADGGPDAGPGAFACNPEQDEDPTGLKPVKYLDSTETVYPASNWRVALEPEVVVNWATFANAEAFEAAYMFDLPSDDIEVAGFLVSRNSAAPSANDESQLVQVAINNTVPGITVTTRASGSNIQSLDGFDTIVNSTFEIQSFTPTDATEIREKIMPALVGRLPDDVTFPDVGWQSGSDERFILVMQTLFRAADGQTIHMGAIARQFDYDDRGRMTGPHSDDMANGSGLTVSLNGEAKECEGDIIDEEAIADIIWIIDESGSTDGERTQIANNASAFFQKALDLGLDFRMGVTDMNDGSMGTFATRPAAALAGDRWLLPNESTAFAAAIKDPSGPGAADGGTESGLTQLAATLARHLPRSDDEFFVRTTAKLAIIIMTDENAEEVEDIPGGIGEGNNEPTPAQEADIASFLEPTIATLIEQDAVVHLISEPLPFDDDPCAGSEHAFGYYELVNPTGGQMGSICQLNLGSTLDAMLDSIVGDASPVQLEYVPISSSITVMRDGVVVPRSRELGWDYRSASNSIVFYGMPVDPANPADIKIGYRRWEEQVIE